MEKILNKTSDVLSFLEGILLAFAATQSLRVFLNEQSEIRWAGAILVVVFGMAAYIAFYRNKKIFYGTAFFLLALPFILFEFFQSLS
jgi:hypothetical protein